MSRVMIIRYFNDEEDESNVFEIGDENYDELKIDALAEVIEKFDADLECYIFEFYVAERHGKKITDKVLMTIIQPNDKGGIDFIEPLKNDTSTDYYDEV